MSFPSTLDELTNDFLSQILNQKVESFTSTRIGETTGYMSEVYRVKLSPDNETLKSVVIKFPNASGSAFLSETYATELEFYKFLDKNNEIAGIQTPTCYFVDSTPKYDKFILVLEDFDEPYSVGNLRKDLKKQEVIQCLIELAKFHAHWWGRMDSIKFEKLSTSLVTTWGASVGNCWNNGAKEKFDVEGVLTDEIEKAANFVGKYGKSIQVKNRTLVHGDFRSDNVLIWRGDESGEIPTKRIVGIDFQIIHWGNPMEDVAYFMSSGVSQGMLQENYLEFLSIYHDELVKQGVEEYSLEECVHDYKENLIYAIVMPVLSAMDTTKEENMTKKQKSDLVMTKIWRARYSTAITEAKSSELIEELGKEFDKFIVESPYPELEASFASVVEFYQKTIPEWNTLTIEDRRNTLALIEKSANSRLPEKAEGIESIDIIPGTDDYPEMKVFTPENPSGKVILYISSCWIGGFGLGESNWRKICETTQSYVVAVHYRYSPEFKHPDLLSDCYNALKCIINDNTKLTIPDVKQVILFGDKQGAHLACCLIRLLIEKNEVSWIDKLILLCPFLDPLCASKSFETIGNRYSSIIGTDNCKFHWKHYISDPIPNSEQPLLFTEKELEQFPQTTIIAAEFDVTKDEAEQFGEQLKNCNVNVTMKIYEKVLNIFFVPFFQSGKEAITFVTEEITK